MGPNETVFITWMGNLVSGAITASEEGFWTAGITKARCSIYVYGEADNSQLLPHLIPALKRCIENTKTYLMLHAIWHLATLIAKVQPGQLVAVHTLLEWNFHPPPSPLALPFISHGNCSPTASEGPQGAHSSTVEKDNIFKKLVKKQWEHPLHFHF